MRKTKVMAILNITPDSFSDGGRLGTMDRVVEAAEAALNAGADILDVGGESTRPGAETIDGGEEIRRTIPAIEAIRQHFPEAVISIDTRKAAVAEAAVEAGATMINDVSGLQYDVGMAEVAARHNAGLIIMHSQGTPETMQIDPSYPEGVVPMVKAFFETQMALAMEAGVQRERIIIDPGFGFGKTLRHNLSLLHYIDAFQSLGVAILIGTSRKSFLALGTGIAAGEREALTAASLALGIRKGASLVRVHDVKTQAPVVRLIDAVLNAE